MIRTSAPKTLTFTAPTVRNQRTLIWLQEQQSSVPWWKWDGVVTSVGDYHRWSSCGASLVGLVLCAEEKGDRNAWLDEVYVIAKKVQFVMLPRHIIGWKTEAYWKENFDNLFQLEDIHESYPFVGRAWDGTAEDAIHILALICRYHRLVDVPLGDRQRACYDMVLEEGSRPAEFVLFTQFYMANEKKRMQELRECLRRNTKCKWIDRIVLLNERDESIAWASFLPQDKAKIEQKVIGRRLTYADFFREVSERYHEGSGLHVIVALANADIYFGAETAEAWRIQWEDRAVCLLRWDDLGEGASKARLFGPRSDSQDVWMFSSTSVANRRWEWNEVDIPLGKPGCDNAILYPLLRQRFLLSNPALSFKTYHLHRSGIRSYKKADTILSPVYIHLEPTYLVDTKQEFTPRESPQHVCNEVVSFTVHSSSMSNEITYCTMLEKDGRYRWEPTVENYYFEPAIPVYRWRKLGLEQGQGQGAGVTPNGLVYDLYRIYTGRAAIQQPEYNYWPSAGVDIFTPLVSCKRMVAIPLADTGMVFGNIEPYLLFYFSRYLRIRSTLSLEERLGFWMPREGLGDLSSQWISDGLPWEQGTACWAEEVVGYLPGPSVAELGREDVMMIRQECPQWQHIPYLEADKADKAVKAVEAVEAVKAVEAVEAVKAVEAVNRTCIVVGDELLTEEWTAMLRNILPSWKVTRVCPGQNEAWFGASLCIIVGGPNTVTKWAPLWRLPVGAVLLEFQQELSVSGECQHVAHVADLSSWIFLLSKGSMEDVRMDILSGVKSWWAKHKVFSF